MTYNEHHDTFEEPFTPDSVEQRINALGTTSPLAQQEHASAPLLHELSALYGQDAASLNHVWERLSAHSAFDQEGLRATEPEVAARAELPPFTGGLPIRGRRHALRRRIGMLSGVACVLLLVGSLVFVLQLARLSPTGNDMARNQVSNYPQLGSQQNIGGDAVTPCPASGKGARSPATTVYAQLAGQAGLYLAGDSGVYRFEPRNAQLQPLWVFNTNGCTLTPTIAPGLEFGPKPAVPSVNTPVTVALGMAYFGVMEAKGNELYALHTSDGSLAWKTPVNLLNQPLVLDSMLYVATTDNSGHEVIQALSAIDGSPRWSYDYTLADTNQSEGLGAVGAGNVFVSMSNTIFALNALSGKLVWSRNIEVGQIISATRFFDGALYATASSTCYNCQSEPGTSAAYAFNAANGSPLWETPKVAGYLTPPTVAQGVVYFGSIDGYVHAVQAGNGEQIWQAYTGGEIRAAPEVADGAVYVGAGLFLGMGDPNTASAHIVALDAARGSKQWTFALPDLNYDDTRPVVAANGVVYVNTLTGPNVLYILRGNNGALLQRVQLAGTAPFENGLSPTLTLAP